MKSRPWPIVILALLHILAPVGNLFTSAWLQHTSAKSLLWVLLHTENAWGLFDFFCLLPIAGVAIYLCKKWSYPVFLLVAGITVFENFLAWRTAPEVVPLGYVIVTFLLDAIFVAYFVIPNVRKVYMDPRVRWWESKPRYLVDTALSLPAESADATPNEATIRDFSEGGIFISTSADLSPHKHLKLAFTILNIPLEVESKLVYHRKGDAPGYGLQFLHTRETLKIARRIATALKKSKFRERTEYDWKSDLIVWFVDLIKHGKGIVPELPKR